MPDYIHLLLTPHESLERTVGIGVRIIKGCFSHRLASKFSVWQRGFTDHRIRGSDYFRIRCNHQNPVTARLCETAESYPYSSANQNLDELPQRLMPHIPKYLQIATTQFPKKTHVKPLYYANQTKQSTSHWRFSFSILLK